MPQIFDLAVVGSGPAAYAALIAAREFNANVAVITGAVAEPVKASSAKIRSASFERQACAGLAEMVQAPDGSCEIFSSAEVGGLANFWGQQLQPYSPGDAWTPCDVLPQWEDYRAACAEIEKALAVTGGSAVFWADGGAGGLELQEPRLLVGTVDRPDAGEGAMTLAVYEMIASLPHATVIKARVSRLVGGPDSVRLALCDGTDLEARRVLLAAGVPGTARLVARSITQLKEARFQDHSPFLLLTFGFHRLTRKWRSSAGRHFNELSIALKTGDRTDLFASVYRMSRAPLSLSTAMFGVGPRLRGRYPPQVVDFVRPIQLWTKTTLSECRLLLQEHSLRGSYIGGGLDPAANLFLNWLKQRGVIFACLRTPPGQGFHFHRLELSFGQGSKVGVDELLYKTFGNCLTCVDASVLPSIGCMPHTLTAMAHSLARARRMLSE